MRKLLLVITCVLTFSACHHETVPVSEGDQMITKEYIDENIYNFYLDLSNLGLTRIPDFSEIATAVQKEDILFLNLSNNQITEISDDLLALPNLKELKLDNNQIKKLENINDIKLLNTLDVYKNQIEEVNLNNLPALASLDLAYNNLDSVDLAKITQLRSLESLQLQHNNINSISGIEALEGLKTLKIESNQVSDVSVLNDMESLENVSLGNNLLSEDVMKEWKEFNEANK